MGLTVLELEVGLQRVAVVFSAKSGGRLGGTPEWSLICIVSVADF